MSDIATLYDSVVSVLVVMLALDDIAEIFDCGPSLAKTSLQTGSINCKNISRWASVVNFRLTSRTNAFCVAPFVDVDERATDVDEASDQKKLVLLLPMKYPKLSKAALSNEMSTSERTNALPIF